MVDMQRIPGYARPVTLYTELDKLGSMMSKVVRYDAIFAV